MQPVGVHIVSQSPSSYIFNIMWLPEHFLSFLTVLCVLTVPYSSKCSGVWFPGEYLQHIRWQWSGDCEDQLHGPVDYGHQAKPLNTSSIFVAVCYNNRLRLRPHKSQIAWVYSFFTYKNIWFVDEADRSQYWRFSGFQPQMFLIKVFFM